MTTKKIRKNLSEKQSYNEKVNYVATLHENKIISLNVDRSSLKSVFENI